MRRCTSKSDIWSAGIIIYYLIYNKLPFEGKTSQEVYNNIINEVISYDKLGLSNSCVNFMQKCLNKNDKLRAKSEDLLEHPWLHDLTHEFIEMNTQ
jgi:calcium-dependent protein kinase